MVPIRRSVYPMLVLGFLLGTLMFAAGCASIQSISVSEIDRGPGHRIRAEDRGHGWFMVSIPELDATARLKALCAGKITGIQTQTWVRNWFMLVQHYHQESTGWCQNP